MKTRIRQASEKRMGTEGASSLAASAFGIAQAMSERARGDLDVGSLEDLRATATKVVRRQGYVMLAVYAVILEELTALGMQTEAVELSDDLKACADILIHFAFTPRNKLPREGE